MVIYTLARFPRPIKPGNQRIRTLRADFVVGRLAAQGICRIVQGSPADCQASVLSAPTYRARSPANQLWGSDARASRAPSFIGHVGWFHLDATCDAGAAFGSEARRFIPSIWGELSAFVGKSALSTGYPPPYPRARRKVVDKGLFACEGEGYTSRVGQSGAKWGERHVPG